MNNPIMALAQMAMNRISSDPSFQKNPQARAFMDIMQRGDIAQGQQMAKNLPRPEGEDEERFLRFTSGNELTAKSWIVSL